MQSLQKRCTTTGLSFQAPILAYEYDELSFLAEGHLGDVLHNPIDNDLWDEWWSKFVSLRIRTGSFGRFLVV